VFPAALAGLMVALLSGCGSAAPAPAPSTPAGSATPTPRSSPSPSPSVAKVVIDGDSVSVVRSDGEVLDDIPYTSAVADAVARLTEALGESPVTSTVTTSSCYPSLDESAWGGLSLWSAADGLNKPEGAQFYVTADGPATGDDVPIVIPSGQAVGDDAAAVRAANPRAPSFDNGRSIDVHYDVVSGSADGDPSEYYGGYAQIRNDRLVLISAPNYYFFEC